MEKISNVALKNFSVMYCVGNVHIVFCFNTKCFIALPYKCGCNTSVLLLDVNNSVVGCEGL